MSENLQQNPGNSSVPPTGAHRATSKKTGPGCGLALVIMFVVYVIAFGVTGGFGLDGDDARFYGDESDQYSRSGYYFGQPIPRFSNEDSRRLAQALSDSEKRYGLCFGWKLTDGSEDADEDYDTETGTLRPSGPDPRSSYDRGSSRGPNTPAGTCSRWAEVQVTVAYTEEDSESWSGVDLDVVGSDNFESYDLPDSSDFAELGIDAETFIDRPVATTGHAALALPLLMTENGTLEPKPVSPGNSAGKPEQPLPPADGGMSGLSTWIWLGVLGAVTVLGLVLGFRGVARQKSAPSTPPGPPPGPPTQGPPPRQGPG
ncbi:hypothetical protein [Haloactinomyces albus]|uniref:Uncharacterized protein n=1 Tax=Haloactinomyces albus TaxID=1352928 RepID=A0AAE3ZB35_9ACTN|nr:hypothetical protein [Haloactinomyces albus]MDR7301641.1 hypothetical protein [Haloactinomyces albus]